MDFIKSFAHGVEKSHLDIDQDCDARYKTHMASTRDILMADIEAFLLRYDMAHTTFGKRAVNDVAFVQRMREGKDPRGSTIDAVRKFMDSYRPPAKRRRGNDRVSA